MGPPLEADPPWLDPPADSMTRGRQGGQGRIDEQGRIDDITGTRDFTLQLPWGLLLGYCVLHWPVACFMHLLNGQVHWLAKAWKACLLCWSMHTHKLNTMLSRSTPSVMYGCSGKHHSISVQLAEPFCIIHHEKEADPSHLHRLGRTSWVTFVKGWIVYWSLTWASEKTQLQRRARKNYVWSNCQSSVGLKMVPLHNTSRATNKPSTSSALVELVCSSSRDITLLSLVVCSEYIPQITMGSLKTTSTLAPFTQKNSKQWTLVCGQFCLILFWEGKITPKIQKIKTCKNNLDVEVDILNFKGCV